MQNTPDVDVIIMLHVEDQMREAFHRPRPYAGQFKFQSVAWRAAGGMACYMPKCLFDGINVAQCDTFVCLLEVVFHCLQNILIGPAPPDHRLEAHLAVWRRMWSRSPSK